MGYLGMLPTMLGFLLVIRDARYASGHYTTSTTPHLLYVSMYSRQRQSPCAYVPIAPAPASAPSTQPSIEPSEKQSIHPSIHHLVEPSQELVIGPPSLSTREHGPFRYASLVLLLLLSLYLRSVPRMMAYYCCCCCYYCRYSSSRHEFARARARRGRMAICSPYSLAANQNARNRFAIYQIGINIMYCPSYTTNLHYWICRRRQDSTTVSYSGGVVDLPRLPP
ncbi:hypothetical protein F5Y14DRAFT_174014 [Nemania sp. NC0429]|nr:hypothetical protein F5Y14DRAFT_174014 [Nemania sp. NC0429]